MHKITVRTTSMTWKLYDILGIHKDASKDEIKRAYKKKAIDTHPDKGGDPEKFKEINHAYSILNNEDTKARYDQLGDENFEASGGVNGGHGMHVDPNDIFRQFFGGGFNFNFHGQEGHASHPQRCADHRHMIKINMNEAFTGVKRNMRVVLHKTCMKCRERCYTCQGQGQITEMRRMGFFTQMLSRACENCSGTGMMVKGSSSCRDCKGNGNYTEEKIIELDIPAGIDTGAIMTFHGMGEQPKRPNDHPGDLQIELFVHPHERLVRHGNDLHFRIKIGLKHSIVGSRINIPYFAGDFYIDTSELGILQPSKQYVIKGKGMPLKGSSEYGNMILSFDIEYPCVKLTHDNAKKIDDLFTEIGIQ